MSDPVSAPDAAEALFKQGFACSQAVLAAYAPRFGLDRDSALRVAAGFGGGMGRMGHTCGAVAGALMVLGLKHGGTRVEDTAAKARTYEQVREFAQRFEAQHQSLECKDLLGCDIRTAAGYAHARNLALFTTLCPRFVRNAAVILDDLLATA